MPEPAAPEANPAPTHEWHPLDPRVIQLDRIAGLIVTLVASAAYASLLLILWVTTELSAVALLLIAAGWPVITIGFAALSWKYPALDYARTAYRIDEDVIEIRKGVWWRSSVHVPRSRVQHLDVSQGPVERRFGLATLSMYTAGTHYGHVPLRGLAHPVALALRDRLLPRTSIDGV